MSGGLGLGPLTRCLAIAQEAQMRGHSVAFLCKKEFRPLVKNIGCEIFTAPKPRPYLGVPVPLYRLSDAAIALGMTDKDYIEQSLKSEFSAIERFKPDVIFAETQLTAAISSNYFKIPLASTASWVDHPNFTSPLFDINESFVGHEVGFNMFLEKYKLPPVSDICELAFLRSQLKIVPSIPEFEPELANNNIDGLRFVGALLYPGIEIGSIPNYLLNSEKEHIIVYMSRGKLKPNYYFPEIIKAFQDSNFRLSIIVDPQTFKEHQKNINGLKNIRLFKKLPGLVAMRRSSLVITRGGQNTTMSSLLAGTPLLIYPGENAEPDFHARNIERCGAGKNFLSDEFTYEKLKRETDLIISDQSFHINAERMGNRIREYGGAYGALVNMEEYIGS